MSEENTSEPLHSYNQPSLLGMNVMDTKSEPFGRVRDVGYIPENVNRQTTFLLALMTSFYWYQLEEGRPLSLLE